MIGQRNGNERRERLNQSTFGISQIRFVSQPVAAMLPPSGWGHIALPEKVSMASELKHDNATQP